MSSPAMEDAPKRKRLKVDPEVLKMREPDKEAKFLSGELRLESLEEAQRLVQQFAFHHNFKVRVDERKADYRVVLRCSRAGKPRPQKVADPKKQRNRPSCKTDCKWQLNLYRVKSGFWHVTKFVQEHNHDLQVPEMAAVKREPTVVDGRSSAALDGRPTLLDGRSSTGTLQKEPEPMRPVDMKFHSDAAEITNVARRLLEELQAKATPLPLLLNSMVPSNSA